MAIVTLLHCAPAQVSPAPVPYLYNSINFDIAYVGTAAPRTEALERFRQALNAQRIAGAVTFSVRKTSTMHLNRVWNVPTLIGFEQIARGRSSPTRRTSDLNVFVAYVPGKFLPAPKPNYRVCGYAYGVTSFVVLTEQFMRPMQETALLLHEFGHIIDPPGEDHCPNDECALYEYVRLNGALYCAACLDRIDRLRER